MITNCFNCGAPLSAMLPTCEYCSSINPNAGDEPLYLQTVLHNDRSTSRRPTEEVIAQAVGSAAQFYAVAAVGAIYQYFRR